MVPGQCPVFVVTASPAFEVSQHPRTRGYISQRAYPDDPAILKSISCSVPIHLYRIACKPSDQSQ